MELEFDWATDRWTDPLTGTDVVKISPDERLHFRNPYFRVNMFTHDGRTTVLCAQDPSGELKNTLWRVDLVTGESDRLLVYDGKSLASWAVAPGSRTVHAIERCHERCHIWSVDLDTGEKSCVEVSEPGVAPSYAECSCDGRYIFAHTALRSTPPGMSSHDRIALMGTQPGRNQLSRIDLADGSAEVLYETDDWWIGHTNPNPVDPDLFMCC